MPNCHSFYLAPESWTNPCILCGQEARQLIRVLRLGPGACVRLFDGRGRWGIFQVHSASRDKAVLLPESVESVPAPSARCILAAGFSKALRRGWFLEKAAELEASALWFWQGEYSGAALPEQEKESWKDSLIAGAKQCGNPWLPELRMLRGGAKALAGRLPEMDRAFILYEGDTGGRLLTRQDLAEAGDILLIVGPEGGFSRSEVQGLADAGALPVSLGPRVLRWETAAVLTLGIAWWARQGLMA
ncbi:MAG: 16S rRNA (uracil(1498)-N(3))-methyltransferase [Deltaproteobacteria bacterium]|jgi:16S rRNA (uracil1498-N3)-methyltransferase|nr:16S rRNA (uracil(1498)-N(3))-methyltransferase [Deltaproteobacteria bacterium]